MKKLLLFVSLLLITLVGFAKDYKTVVLTTTPPMHCASCEARIKNCLKFEKGVKEIVTNVEKQTVTIKYDAEKIDVATLKAKLAKIDYSTEVCPIKETSAKNE